MLAHLLLIGLLAGCASPETPVETAALPDAAPASPAGSAASPGGPEATPDAPTSGAPRVVEGAGTFVLAAGGIGLQHDAVPQTFVGKEGSFTFETFLNESVLIDLDFQGTVGGLGLRVTLPDGSSEIFATQDGSGETSIQARFEKMDAGTWTCEPEVFGPRANARYAFTATMASP